jgi:cytochrome c
LNRLAPCLLLTAALFALSQPACADLALATAKGCLSCHTVDRKLLGPAYQDVAAKYRNDAGAAARLTQKVMSGGGGVWGTAKMPSNPQLTEAEAKKLVAWVLSQK